MANLKELKKRIKSTQSIGKMMGAIKMIAASRLHQARTLMPKTLDFYAQINNSVNELYGFIEANSSYSKVSLEYIGREIKKNNTALVIVITSDKGLCGGYNSNINRHAKQLVEKLKQDGKEYIVLPLGSKAKKYAKDYFKQFALLERYKSIMPEGFKTEVEFLDWIPHSKGVEFDVVSDIAKYVWELYHKIGLIDSCYVVSSKFVSVLKQEAVTNKILPFEVSEFKNNEAVDYSPSATDVLEFIIEQHLSANLYSIWSTGILSEHAARMNAMDNASKNAKEMKDKLTLIYNRNRQAQVTKELNEIVAGAEAV